MTDRLILAMTGLAQSGKDTVGEHLSGVHGFARDAFADDLKASLYAINPTILKSDAPGGAPFEMLADFVDRVGWDEARKHPTVHGLLHRTGTEGGWMIHGERLWIDRVAQRVSELPRRQSVVITDCRTPQEAAWVRAVGGFIVRVDRAGQAQPQGELAEHSSESAINPHDFLIVNNGSLASLRAQVEAVLALAIDRHAQNSPRTPTGKVELRGLRNAARVFSLR